MLESLTIFSRGGIVLFQYNASPSMVGAEDGPAHSCELLSSMLVGKILTDAGNTKTYHIAEGLTFLWKTEGEVVVVALYPDILFEGPRQYLRNWAQSLVDSTLDEYKIFYQQAVAQDPALVGTRPDPTLFAKTFDVLLQRSKYKNHGEAPNLEEVKTTDKAPKAETKAKKEGKEKRQWHDGNAKVTKQAMAELDKSAPGDSDESAKAESLEKALQEARQAYLPDSSEVEEHLKKQKELEKGDTNSWSSSVTGMLQQLSGSKVLSASDLDKPLNSMEEMLTSKNVAREISHELCEAVRAKLVGKKLNSLYRVQTAVRQALESVLQRILEKNRIDLLRNVKAKRGDGSMLASLSSKNRQPYVISVMGINGIGKTTTLAKLAYYFQQNGCKPLLVAADTFRSGAVEQLKVHASCLELPLFSQGYSKDPSAVAKAAIKEATEKGNDVVLIDTAGRMQNNVPLMKALTKLVDENKPDLRIMVCEALVGHDGLDQYKMFARASKGVDGLILTKMDTVADKVGVAMTLAHQTGTPIVFCGTGQKYHHLSPLSVPMTVKSLLA